VDHRAELGEFLRARRTALAPEQVGLPSGRHRRVPGLRREEVALLAGVSVTWYTWLEQGRRINASVDVLRAIGRALRLDEAGQQHLVDLARSDGAAPLPAPTDAPDALVRLIDALEPAPAYVLGARWQFLARNAAQARLYPRIEELADDERNLLWVLFADPATRQPIVDWDIHARQALAEFRAATTPLRHEPAVVELVERLAGCSDEFARWWAEHDVAHFETRLRRFAHPSAGVVTFEYQQLRPAEWPTLTGDLPAPRSRRRLGAAPRRAPPHRVIAGAPLTRPNRLPARVATAGRHRAAST
jgi:transcriptional regulator with XRE-family HTH domain